MKQHRKDYYSIKAISNMTNVSVSVVEYTIMKKNLDVRTTEGRRTISLSEFTEARKGMTVGRNKQEKKEFDFDFERLTEKIFSEGRTMTEFFRESGLSRNRYYSIRSGVVYPTKNEIKILKESL